jgi:hypothetical protein
VQGLDVLCQAAGVGEIIVDRIEILVGIGSNKVGH